MSLAWDYMALKNRLAEIKANCGSNDWAEPGSVGIEDNLLEMVRKFLVRCGSATMPEIIPEHSGMIGVLWENRSGERPNSYLIFRIAPDGKTSITARSYDLLMFYGEDRIDEQGKGDWLMSVLAKQW